MKNYLKEIKLVSTCYDMGFFSVQFTQKKDHYSIQFCLEEAVRQSSDMKDETRYVKKVIDNGGYDDGICGDINYKAFKKFGKDFCLNLLNKELRKHRIN